MTAVTETSHVWSITITGTTGTTPWAYDVTAAPASPVEVAPDRTRLVDATVTLASTRTPMGTATITLALAAGDPLVQLLDAREDARVTIRAGYGTTVWPDAGTIAVLKVDDVGANDAGETVLTASSLESVILDGSELDVPYTRATDDRSHILDLVEAAGLSRDDIDQTQLPFTPRAYQMTTADAWDGIASIMADVGWVMTTADAVPLTVRPARSGAEDPVVDLVTGPHGTIVRDAPGTSRAQWATRVRIRHTWTTIVGDQGLSGLIEREITASATSDRHRTGNGRTMSVVRDTSTTQAAANLAAARMLDRAELRGRVRRVAAIAHYWVRPEDVVTVEGERLVVDQVTYSTAGLMELVLRGAPPAWLISHVTAAYGSIAAVTATYPTIRDLRAGPAV